jgi:CDP-diacylglycerol--glycerol-3-phosphate 3-phosphatidyltransferase
MNTTFGAFYDSTLDRVGESALFAGIALHFLRGGLPANQMALGVMLAIAALTASLLVSYTRARAEGLGLDCKVGIAARAERLLVLGAPTLVFGAGRDGRLLLWIVAFLALVTTITVIQRVVHVARTVSLTSGESTPRRRDTRPGHAPIRKGT